MIRVGSSELHGIAQESAKYPPANVVYREAQPSKSLISKMIKSPAKGVLNYFEQSNFEYIEAPLFPVRTPCNWIYTPADTATAMAFNFLGLPTPRTLREYYLKYLFERDNFKALLFKSQAGLRTLEEYPTLASDSVRSKAGVLYPAIREHQEINRDGRHDINIIFVGEFFRKGGIHVINAFEELQKEVSNIKLVICADIKKHFNHHLRPKFLNRIKINSAISLNFVSRDTLFSEILPSGDIFISPTYNESFGYALLEAMAMGLPVISTNIFAIPEIVEDKKSGILIDIKDQSFIKSQKGYSVENIPEDFINYMDVEVTNALRRLIIDRELRLEMGHIGRSIARREFSFEKRNMALAGIYN